ncbi:unnamed protein product [Adineta ricciae]|uniref:Uncharacterized protein n=1 Tax=Adineta ricciae TaxID=249248 RepID=A0A815ZA95_ADIRI|nr:unnamed protein product [Adineta ricciae]
MPLSIESEIDLLYHLSTMSEHVLPKGIFYLLLWKRLNQSSIPPAFTFNEMIDHLRTLYDESVFDNPELPESNDHDFEWHPAQTEQENEAQQQVEKDLSNKSEPTAIAPAPSPAVTKSRKRPPSPSSGTSNGDSGRRSGRSKPNTQPKDDDEQQQSKADKRKSTKDASRISTRSIPATDSIGTRLRGQK